ncbi:MAG: PorV/PorQ family protein [Planctomycetia bacterium]|nr:PorV/PorQ family protein [Planctomycetia bacterium]
MKKIIIIVLIALAMVSAQSKVGTSAAQFLGIGVGPKSIAMGGAFTSIADDASTLYWNPGAISRLEKSQTMFSSINWLVDTNVNLFAAVLKLNQSNAIGFFFTQLDYGDELITTLYEQSGTDLYWKASDLVTGLSYSRNLTNRFSMGGSLKYISQRIHNESASSVALDVGLLYQSLSKIFRIGMSISNFGTDMTMDGKDLFRKIDLDPDNSGHNETIVAKLKTDAWPLPLFFRVGVSSDILKTDIVRLTLASDFFMPSDDVESVNFGMEAGFLERVFLRAGYKSIGNSNSEEGFTVGIGAKAYVSGFGVVIDYAIQDFGRLGYIPHWGLSLSF